MELPEWRLGDIPFVSLRLDATYPKVRENWRIESKGVVITAAVRGDGRREIVGVNIGDSENATWLTEFLRNLTDRGMGGVHLVFSDALRGLTAAIGKSSKAAPRSAAASARCEDLPSCPTRASPAHRRTDPDRGCHALHDCIRPSRRGRRGPHQPRQRPDAHGNPRSAR